MTDDENNFDSASCRRHEELIHISRVRALNNEEIKEYLAHEENCYIHSPEGLLLELGLPTDVFDKGSPEHGILPMSEFIKKVLRRAGLERKPS